MVRRIFPLLLVLILLAGQAFAAPAWKENTPGQAMFKAYITRVNTALAEHGESPVNSLFEMYERVAEMGITFEEDAETPEGVEITANLYYDSINSVQIRVNEVTRFPRIAAAFLLALSPESMTWEQAIDSPSRHAQKAAENPQNSWEDPVEELNGTAPRAYYAYYPNQYHDGVSWIQLTIVFPLAGYWSPETGGDGVLSGETPTKGPDTYSDADEGYEGYFSTDDYEHLEVFSTATPEPDSAAAEEQEAWRD